MIWVGYEVGAGDGGVNYEWEGDGMGMGLRRGCGEMGVGDELKGVFSSSSTRCRFVSCPALLYRGSAHLISAQPILPPSHVCVCPTPTAQDRTVHSNLNTSVLSKEKNRAASCVVLLLWYISPTALIARRVMSCHLTRRAVP